MQARKIILLWFDNDGGRKEMESQRNPHWEGQDAYWKQESRTDKEDLSPQAQLVIGDWSKASLAPL